MKYLMQFSVKCTGCQRDVSVLSRDDQAGLLYSLHGRVAGNLADRCGNSGLEYKR